MAVLGINGLAALVGKLLFLFSDFAADSLRAYVSFVAILNKFTSLVSLPMLGSIYLNVFLKVLWPHVFILNILFDLKKFLYGFKAFVEVLQFLKRLLKPKLNGRSGISHIVDDHV